MLNTKIEKHHNLLLSFQYPGPDLILVSGALGLRFLYENNSKSVFPCSRSRTDQHSLVVFLGIVKELWPSPEDVVFQEAIKKHLWISPLSMRAYTGS